MSEKPIKLSRVLEEMIRKGRAEEAMNYQLYLLLHLGVLRGFSERQIMRMTIDEITRFLFVPPRPLKYRNWDTFYWGEAAFAHP